MASEENSSIPAAETTTTPSTMAPHDLFTTLKNWWLADKSHWSAWHTECKESYDFVAGHGQWTTDERQFLLSDAGGKRQPITFNLILTFVKAVCGIEINSRHDIVFLPRLTRQDVVKKNELLTGASDYMADEADAGRAESAAFGDAVKTGLGFVETGISYDKEADGGYSEERVPPLEMLIDCKARKANAADARRMSHTKSDIPLAEAKAMFPEIEDVAMLDATWAKLGPEGEDPKPKEDRVLREENSEAADEKSTVTIVRMQWWEREPYMRVAAPTPEDPRGTQDVPMDQWKNLEKVSKKAKQPLPRAVRQTRKVYKQAWVGATVLRVEEAPCKDHFSWKVITGEPDENKGTWYGMVRVAHDAQKFCNKWMVQYLHILNSTAKGGILYEDGAIEDLPDFLESYAQVDKPTKVAGGAISGSRLMPKPGNAIGDGYIKLAEFAMGIIPKLLGLPMELIGLREVNQPGVLEAHRKQAGMTILATLFDSLKQCRKHIGQTRLYLIQEYLSDGRWVRIVGPEGAQYQQLVKDKVAGRYDVIVEDAPTAPNQKEQTWVLLQPMIAMFSDQLATNPELLGLILEQSPLPASFVEKLKELMMKPPSPEQVEQQQIMKAGAQAKVAKDQASVAKAQADVGKTKADTKQTEIETMLMVMEAGFEAMRAKREKAAPIEQPMAEAA